MPHRTEQPKAATPESRFQTTHWSVILAAGENDQSTRASAALEALCRTYWYALYAYVRRRGHSQEDAEDLIQGFFAGLLRREAFRQVVPGGGKFRSFLLVALNRFMVDAHHRNRAQKRGGGQEIISFDVEDAEKRYQIEPRHSDTPEKLYERRWASTVLSQAVTRLEREFVAAGKAGLFAQLRGYLLDQDEGTTRAEIAAAIGMTVEAVKKASQRMRLRYQEIIRETIADTVATQAEVEDELAHLRSMLRG